MLLLLIVGKFVVRRWDVIQWHTVRAKFRENLSILKDGRVVRGSAGTCACGDELSLYFRIKAG